MFRTKNLVILATLLLFAFSSLFASRALRSAKLYSSQGKDDKALEYYTKYISEETDTENEDYIEALYAVSEIYFYEKIPSPDGTKIDLYEKAYEYYNKCLDTIAKVEGKVDIEKENIDLKMEDDQGNVRKMTFADVKRVSALKVDACSVKIYNIGLNYFTQNDFDNANTAIDRLLKMNPEYANAYLLLGNIAIKQENLEKAAEYFTIAAEKEPERNELKATAASILYNLKRYQDAANLYMKMAVAEPDTSAHYMNMAICYVNMKNDSLAYLNFQKTLELDPYNADALVYASNYAMEYKENKKRAEYLGKLVELHPENTEYLMSLCYLLYNEKMYDEVLKYAEMWHNLQPNEKQAVQLLYRASTELKKNDLVKKYEAMLKKMK